MKHKSSDKFTTPIPTRVIQVINGSNLLPSTYWQVSDTQTAWYMNSGIRELWSTGDRFHLQVLL